MRFSMEFLSFLRALSLEPVDDSVISKMVGSVKFQGNRIDTSELGPETTESLTRLLSSERMDYEEVDELEGRNGGEVTLFGDLKLPPINRALYISRRLEHDVVLLPNPGSGKKKKRVSRWKLLEGELLLRMQEAAGNDAQDENQLGRGEIFAISLAASSNGGGERGDQNLRIEGESSDELTNDNELLKASDLLKWANKETHRHLCASHNEDEDMEEDANENMEVDEIREKNELEKVMKQFLDRWVEPPGEAKLRLIELDEVENPDVQFSSLCHVANLFTVHWLQAFREGGLIWKKTHGPLKMFRLRLNSISYQEDKWFPFLEHKAWQNVICISGIAGMGKTTFLAKIAHVIKDKYKNRLICYIDLKQLSDLMETLNVEKLNILKFPELISKYVDIEKGLDRRIFKCLMSSIEGERTEPKVELLMDGLEKMSEKTRQIFVNFLQEEWSVCDKWSFRVWITTRPHLKYEIEEAFSIVAYDLDSVNRSDMIQYFTMYNEYTNVEHGSDVFVVANALFSSSLRTYLRIDLGGLLGAPERMMAFEAFMKQNNYPDPFKLNASFIMGEVIMKSVRRSYVKKFCQHLKSDEEKTRRTEDILSMHIPLAIQVSSGENGGPTDPIDFVDQLSSQEEANLLDFGIVTKNKEGKFYFINAAYPAYILAEHYCTVVPDHSIKSDFFLNYVLIKDACDPIRQFYEELLANGMDYSISLEWMRIVRNFIMKTYFLSNDVFDHESVSVHTNILQLAIIDQRLRLAKLILRSFAPEHTVECRRLICRKVRIQFSDMRQSVKNCRLEHAHTSGARNYANPPKNGTIKIKQYVELSSLSLAILLGDRELVHTMYIILGVEGGAHMEEFTDSDNFHFTPLHLSVIGCNPQTFSYLTIMRGMSPNKLDAYGHLPLHLLFFNRWVLRFPAMGIGTLDIESEVLREVHICKYYEDELDPEWNERVGKVADRAGFLPLLSTGFAMAYSKIQMKQSLNFSYQGSSHPWKICYYKSYKTYISLAKSLSGRTLINFMDKVEGPWGQVSPPFHFACAAGYLPMLEAMLEKGVKLNIRDTKNRTALYTALCKEQMHVVQFLLERGIDRDISKKINGIPLLHHLSIQNLSSAISYLVVELNVDVDQRPKEGLDNCTPLHMACLGGCLEAAETLIGLGADVNAKDDEQYTPLLHAAHPTASCNLNLVKLLISRGADLNAGIESEEGRTCLHQAVLTKNIPLIECLLEYGKGTIDVNAVTHKGQSALHLACKKKGNKEILMALIKAGAKVDLQDVKGQTPLFIFCSENHEDKAMALYLIKQGASIFQVNSEGQSLLREVNKWDAVIGEMIYNSWRTIKENQEKLDRGKRLCRRKLSELSV